MDLSDLLEARRPLSVNYAGQAFAIEYDPGSYDQTVQAKAGGLQKLDDEDPRKLEYVNFVLAAVLKSWDLTDRGQKVPITAEVIGRLPFVLRAAMAGAIMADMTSGPDPKAQPPSSPSTSLPAANGVAAPTGTPSSERPIAAGASPG